MKKRLKAVLFDMDSVLFNSMPYHSEAWHQVMKTHGLDLSRKEAYMHEGRTGASTINIVFQRELGKEYNIGGPLYFFEKACGISGYLLGVNPFNQPGVEAYKKNMFALLNKPGYEEESKAIQAKL